jgi:hypothetical protein
VPIVLVRVVVLLRRQRGNGPTTAPDPARTLPREVSA